PERNRHSRLAKSRTVAKQAIERSLGASSRSYSISLFEVRNGDEHSGVVIAIMNLAVYGDFVMLCLTSASLLSSVSKPFDPPHALRRFFARFIDVLLASSLVIAVEALIPTKVRLDPLVFLMAVCCGWMFVEAQLLVLWQTTPGKFLLKTRIETIDGKSVTYGRALDR